MVTLEAMRALFGTLPPATPSLAQGAQPMPAQNEAAAGRMKIRAWKLLSLKVHLIWMTLDITSISLDAQLPASPVGYLSMVDLCQKWGLG